MLVDWLSSSFELQRHDVLSCSKGPSCSKRGKTALMILNAIRDACRPFLEQALDEEFPPTSTPVDAPVTNTASKKKGDGKRRIRPAMVQVTSSAATKGNLVGLDSSFDPLLPKQPPNPSNKLAPTNNSSFMTPTKAKTATDALKTPTPIKAVFQGVDHESRVPEVENLVQVYVTLVDACLAPSTAMELHLLIRLLHTPNRQPSTLDATTFSDVLNSFQRCQSFGVLALKQLSHVIQRFDTNFLQNLVQCPQFRAQLPETTKEIEGAIQEATANSQAYIRSAPRSQTAQLTLPFDHSRDSRHNYKTQEQQAMYKNREDTRDGFLYELRLFLSARGRLVDASESDRAVEQIQKASRLILDNLMDSNLPWFSEFFCDLLLQIGLVPLEETDEDLLKMENKDKLQKLHRRFSTKTAHSSKSTRKLSLNPTSQSNSSPTVEAQQLFPGHQEFFFLFLVMSDSLRLGTHLKMHLARKLQNLVSNATVDGLEERTLEMKLLARFLGVLVFSPNWLSNPSTGMSQCGLGQLAAIDLRITEYLETAWPNDSLITAVPWVVDLLKLATWDSSKETSVLYKQVVCLLRTIQLRLATDDALRNPSMMVVMLCLESLFGDFIGVARLGASSGFVLPERNEKGARSEKGIDAAKVLYDSSTVFLANSHVEELYTLASRLSRADIISICSPGVSRKLRPSTLLPTPPSVKNLRAMSSNGATSDFRFELNGQGLDLVQRKLQDTFFHQHEDMKLSCEFIGSRALKKALTNLVERISSHEGTSPNTAEVQLTQETARARLAYSLTRDIEFGLRLVMPSSLPDSVLRIAASLTTARAMFCYQGVVENAITLAIQTIGGASQETGPRELFEGLSISAENNDSTSESSLPKTTQAISRLLMDLQLVWSTGTYENVATSLMVVNRELDCYLTSVAGLKIPDSKELRAFFECVLQLDGFSYAVMSWALSVVDDDSQQQSMRWSVLSGYVRLAVRISSLARHGLLTVKYVLSDWNGMSTMIRLAVSVGETDSLKSLLKDVVQSHLIKPSWIRNALRVASKDASSGDGPATKLTSIIDSLSTSSQSG